MFNYKLYYYDNTLTNLTFISGMVRPFATTDTLDDTLDSGRIMVTGLSVLPPLKPLSVVRIDILDKNTPVGHRNYCVGDLKSVKRRYEQNIYLYDIELSLVELTKKLERIICDTMTFSDNLGKDYLTNANPANPEITYNLPAIAEGHPFDAVPYYYTVYAAKSPITVIPTQTKFGGLHKPYYWKGIGSGGIGTHLYQTVTVVNSSGETVYSQSAEADAAGNLNMASGTFVPTDGVYTITYSGYCEKRTVGGSSAYTYSAVYTIAATSNIAPKEPWTVGMVVEKLLTSGKTRRNGIDQYLFYKETSPWYQDILAPEFFITRKTLFESLLEIGGYIHAIPRLVINEGKYMIVFDKLGKGTTRTIVGDLTYEEKGWAIEDYHGAIDTIVENMVNTADLKQGTIVEPSQKGFKTIRCEPSGVKINADTMTILTQYPIYSVTRLEVSAVIGGVSYKGDITPYVFEQAEYNTLTEYSGAAYPYSKAFAITFTQGDNKITGLNFTIKNATTISSAFENFAIYNIISQALGVKLGDSDYINLGFRVTYIPTVTARIKQFKPIKGLSTNNELVYNQSGCGVECNYYGERLRGAVARLGNEVVTRTYNFEKYENIPKVGELVDGMYVAVVNSQYDQEVIKSTLVMTPNFNKLSEWVGIDSNIRYYDVSEKQSVDRLMNYSETCLISNNSLANIATYKPMITKNALYVLSNTFTQTPIGLSPTTGSPTCVEIITYAKDDDINPIARINLPISKFGQGNSICFQFSTLDNYGAGYQAKGFSGGLTIENKNNRILRNVPYANAYGDFYAMRLNFNYQALSETAAAQTDYNGASNLLPQNTALTIVNNTKLTTLDYPLIVQKDGKENINFTYQIHFVSDNADIIKGSALTYSNCLVSVVNQSKAGVLYLLPYTLDRKSTRLNSSH